MFRIVTSRSVKFAAFGLSVAVASTAFACPRPGGGGYGGGYSRPVQYAQPHYYSQPQYQPAPQYHAQPSYPSTPVYDSQPGFALQPNFPQDSTFPGQGQPLPQTQPQNVPAQTPPAQVAQAPQSQPVDTQAIVSQTTGASADASRTALEILAGMSALPETQAAEATSLAPSQPAVDPRVGTWIAKLGNGAEIRLELKADGTFLWTATQGGKTSSFRGSYAFVADTLTLARSSDQQKLAGKVASVANGFNFKLDGSRDAGLDFVRG